MPAEASAHHIAPVPRSHNALLCPDTSANVESRDTLRAIQATLEARTGSTERASPCALALQLLLPPGSAQRLRDAGDFNRSLARQLNAIVEDKTELRVTRMLAALLLAQVRAPSSFR